MKALAREGKVVVVTTSAMIICVLVLSALYLLFASQLLSTSTHSDIQGLIQQLFQNPSLSLAYSQDRLMLSRIALVSIGAYLVTLMGLYARTTRRLVVDFFSAVAHPLNLAVFRIVFFWMMFNMIDLETQVWYSQIPRILIDAPRGLDTLLPLLPINPTLVIITSVVFTAACFTSMIGLFTRISTVTTLVAGMYALSIPQFYGKVNHMHHLLWFLAILAASRCGDALSVDAMVAAWRRADKGQTEPPGPARVYALPLRITWLLIGIIYFFPGWRKAWDGGVDWALSDNLKYHMYAKWFDLNSWTPAFRIDQYPLLYQLSAVGTIVFELGFIVLLFFPLLRPALALGGLLFHTMIYEIMRISFRSLQMCYVVFFDWFGILQRIGGWLYRDTMYVVYDGNCQLCRRTIAILRVFDLFGRIAYVNALDEAALEKAGLGWLDRMAIVTNMHTVIGQRTYVGYAAYQALAARIPFLWPIWPLLQLKPVMSIGERVYRRVADSRVCSIQRKPVAAERTPVRPWAGVGPVVLVGGLLILGNSIAGARGMVTTWPLAGYPPFSDLKGPEVQKLRMVVYDTNGAPIPLNNNAPSVHLTTTRWDGMMRNVLETDDPDRRREMFMSLWHLWEQENKGVHNVSRVQFYDMTYITVPERQQENPLHQELLYEISLAPATANQ